MQMESLEFRSVAAFISDTIGDKTTANVVFAAADKIDELANKLDEIRALLDMPSDERGITWWQWIDQGIDEELANSLRSILNDTD